MKYDKFWVGGLFLVIGLWLFVIIATLYVFIIPQNMLINEDIDLRIPTFFLMLFNLMYLLLGMFIFIVYLLKIDELKKSHIRIKSKKPSTNSLCSIIIPARDEESVIKRAVLRCLGQTYYNIEVLVICHNSSDRTYEEAQVDDERVRAFDLKTKAAGKSIALNYGVDQSRGNYILVLDADGVLENDFIASAIPAFDDDDYVAVQGRIFPINRNYNFLTKMMAMEEDLWQEPVMTLRSVLGKRCPLLGTGFLVRKDILIEAGKFTNSLVDDHELTCRLFMKGHRIMYLPYCRGYAEEPPSLEVMLRQRARWCRGFINCLNKKMAESTDIVGYFLWLLPIGSFFGSIIFFIIAYSSIYNFIFEYIPFSFTYLPIQLWFLVAGIVLSLDSLVLLKVHGLKKGLKYIAYLMLFIPFSQYGLVVLYKALFVKTWGTTKTVHGFMAKSSEEIPTIKQTQK
jgi:cellulose synthase/poly-beta-1,6-N-acetylglucosamine synthase-like glycosyltransferase